MVAGDVRKHISGTFLFYCTAVCTFNMLGTVLTVRVMSPLLRQAHSFLRTEVELQVKLSSQ